MHLSQGHYLLDLENGCGGASEELPLATPEQPHAQTLPLALVGHSEGLVQALVPPRLLYSGLTHWIKLFLIYTEMKRKPDPRCLFVMDILHSLEGSWSCNGNSGGDSPGGQGGLPEATG